MKAYGNATIGSVEVKDDLLKKIASLEAEYASKLKRNALVESFDAKIEYKNKEIEGKDLVLKGLNISIFDKETRNAKLDEKFGKTINEIEKLKKEKAALLKENEESNEKFVRSYEIGVKQIKVNKDIIKDQEQEIKDNTVLIKEQLKVININNKSVDASKIQSDNEKAELLVQKKLVNEEKALLDKYKKESIIERNILSEIKIEIDKEKKDIATKKEGIVNYAKSVDQDIKKKQVSVLEINANLNRREMLIKEKAIQLKERIEQSEKFYDKKFNIILDDLLK